MAITTALASMTSFSQALPTTNNPRDVSFSSYLNTEEETFIRELAESRQDLKSETAIQDKDHIHLNQHHYHSERDKKKDGEIGVFGAEKYFSGGMDDDDSPRVARMVSHLPAKYHKQKKDHIQQTAPPGVVLDLVKPKLHLGTPSVRSESSCNSRTALVRGSLIRKPSGKKTSKVQGKSLLAAIGCNCYCSDKESVDVHEATDEVRFKKPVTDPVAVQQYNATSRQLPIKQSIRISLDLNKQKFQGEGSWIKEDNHKIHYCKDFDKLGIGLRKENCFTFPALSSPSGNLPLKSQVLEFQEEPKSRTTLEAYGTSVTEKKTSSSGLEKKLTLLPWDFLTPRMEQEAQIPAFSGGGYDNDNESVASSDLFEIESFSGKVNPSLARQGSDATPGCLTPTTCYAPSEASIEWSVVTASAADFSVLSNYDLEHRPWTVTGSPTRESTVTGISKTRNGKERELHRTGILLGCNSQKAVDVAGDVHRANDRVIINNNNESRDRRTSDSYLPALASFRADQGNLAYGQFQVIASATANANSLPRSHFPNSSHRLYV